MGSEGWFDHYRRTRRYEKPFMVIQYCFEFFQIVQYCCTLSYFNNVIACVYRFEEELTLRNVKPYTMKI